MKETIKIELSIREALKVIGVPVDDNDTIIEIDGFVIETTEGDWIEDPVSGEWFFVSEEEAA